MKDPNTGSFKYKIWGYCGITHSSHMYTQQKLRTEAKFIIQEQQ